MSLHLEELTLRICRGIPSHPRHRFIPLLRGDEWYDDECDDSNRELKELDEDPEGTETGCEGEDCEYGGRGGRGSRGSP